MKINIRKSVFETNSSSMHSVAIIGSNHFNKSKLGSDKDNTVYIRPGEYGWGYELLKSPTEKLSYVITMIRYHDENHDIEDSIYFKWLSEMVLDYTGCKLKIHKLISKYYPYGYIDHRSTNTLNSFWSDQEEEFKSNMRDLIFNDKYFIIIDCDNH